MPKPQRTVALCALLCALHGVCAVTYGEVGVGSQYQRFGRPITDTSAIRSGADAVFAAVDGADDAQKLAAKTCDENFVFSEVFGKCLPAPGKDGYIGKANAYDETIKGKAAPAAGESTFMPISAQPYASMSHALPLRSDVRAQALSAANTEQQPTPAPTPQPRDEPQTRGRAIAPVRQLRLACPAGFAFEPVMGACIAPANRAMIAPEQLRQQQQAMRMFRRGGEDDNDDDSDERGRERMREHMLRRGRFRRHMFGRRFGFGGGPRILAPVFVFVLPPLDRNATSRFGMGFGGRMQRIHEVHPSMVGPVGSTTPRAEPATPAAAAPEQPIAKPKESAPEKPIEHERRPETPSESESKPKPMGAPKGTAGTGTPEAPKPLRGAFVNPIVGSGKVLPLKSQSAIESEPTRVDAGVNDRAIDKIAPLQRAESEHAVVPEPLLKRHAFVSPFVVSHSDAA